ncbi:MAG: alpha/beta fold hydrolase [Planctomycetota bacterium]
MPAITARDGTRIHCEDTGEGPPILLIPGLGASSKVWGAFPKALSAHRLRVIVYDPRGFGRSPAPPDRISMASMTSDVKDLLDGLGVPTVQLFGVSMGGLIALRFTAAHPTQVSKLVLVSTPGKMSPWARRMLDLFEIMARRLSPREYVKMMATLSLSTTPFENQGRRVVDMENALVPDDREMPCILAQVEAVRTLPRQPIVETIEAPALILSGRQDFLTPPSFGEALQELLPHAQRGLLDGGHACLVESTDEGLVRILTFLRDTPRGGASA